MDTSKLDKLEQSISDLDNEVVQGLLKRLLAVREAEWKTVMPPLQQECETALKRIGEAIQQLDGVMRKTMRARDTAKQMSDLHKEIEAGIPPASLAEHIRAIVKNTLALGDNIIHVDGVQDQLVNSGVILSVQNPAAVIASILARDERLEKIEKGQFREKMPKAQ